MISGEEAWGAVRVSGVDGVEVRALCRLPDIVYFNHGKT